MLTGALMIAFGVLAFWIYAQGSSIIRRAQDWPTTQGEILERGLGPAMAGRRNYLPLVKYTYSVDGKSYTNDQVYSIRKSGGLPDKMRELANSLPNPVPVHYNPKDPSETYLVINPKGSVWIAFGMGVFVTLLGLLMFLAGALGTSK